MDEDPDDPRGTVTRMADALDAMLAADERNIQRIAELERYVKELESENVQLTQGRVTAGEQIKDLTSELRATRKLLRAADIQLADVRKKEVDPLTRRVAQLSAELAMLREGAATAEANVIAYRFPGDGVPDIVVRWRGGEWWSVTDGGSRYWTMQTGWVSAAHPHAKDHALFTRASALMHAQALMEAARKKNTERNP